MKLEIGAWSGSRAYTVGLEEALAFARAYDPQRFHLDEDAAAANPLFGRVSISGWLTCAIAMRLTVDSWETEGERPLGGAGIEDIRWSRPVFPGDTLTAAFEVLGVTEGKPRAGMRIVRVATEVSNQDNAVVMRHVSNVIFPAATPPVEHGEDAAERETAISS